MRMVAVATLVLGVVGCGRQPQAPTAPATTSGAGRCPVTIGNSDGPPGENPSASYFGNGALWTILPDDGIDRGGTPQPDGSTGQKYPWWTVGTEGGLTIEGRRLDAAAPSPLRARTNRGWPERPFAEVRGGRSWSSAVYFPTEGCWRVTGRVGATSLTFVVFMLN
jgi:hypothetical protein